ncbi:hypothetical protein C1I97_03515 [Streptomyces sp. NTH33]|uniref:hypothetical protein n=1 Tax=Streptomyces sp. NTH33 TaxID=1735453 RepID=UPI000DAAB6C2|nr:hypothetical protein [Streptomyces sp. NTH33]PZH18662.1 hypothetical protein C1I97_03515 [Streptomyces sp. NTH33]
MPQLRVGMLLLADRGSDGYPLIRTAAATSAHLLAQVQSSRVPAVLHELADGSYLSVITRTGRRHSIPPITEGVAVRVIEARVTARSADGKSKNGHLDNCTGLRNSPERAF